VEGASGGARWSPDGTLIACSGRVGEKAGLITVRADGSQPTFIAPTQGTNHPLPSAGDRITWSPHGKQIAFISPTPRPQTEALAPTQQHTPASSPPAPAPKQRRKPAPPQSSPLPWKSRGLPKG